MSRPRTAIAAESYSPTEKHDLGDYQDVNRLFKRLGVAVIGGQRQGNPLGTGEVLRQRWIDHGYVRRRRAELWTIVHALMLKQLGKDGIAKGPYGAHYPRKKAEYQNSDRDWTPKWIDNAARRYACKRLVRDLWREWRRLAREMTELDIAA